jgi:hypothetical protein
MPALADEPTPAPTPASPAEAPAAAPAPAPAPVPAPAEAPAPVAEPPAPAPPVVAPAAAEAEKPAPDGDGDEASRPSGVRLALDLGFQRALDGAKDRLSNGSPTLLPLGADISFRTSKTFLVGAHGYAALASRDDCIAADSCRARGYGFGAHVEGMVKRGRSYAIWLRYGVGYEILYQGGLPLDPAGHMVKDAIDLVDFRVGADLTVHRGQDGKTARIGPFAGLVAGTMVNQSGITKQNGSGSQPKNLNRDSGSAHVWFALGVRATLDP